MLKLTLGMSHLFLSPTHLLYVFLAIYKTHPFILCLCVACGDTQALQTSCQLLLPTVIVKGFLLVHQCSAFFKYLHSLLMSPWRVVPWNCSLQTPLLVVCLQRLGWNHSHNQGLPPPFIALNISKTSSLLMGLNGPVLRTGPMGDV